jgi:hypothetical protein
MPDFDYLAEAIGMTYCLFVALVLIIAVLYNTLMAPSNDYEIRKSRIGYYNNEQETWWERSFRSYFYNPYFDRTYQVVPYTCLSGKTGKVLLLTFRVLTFLYFIAIPFIFNVTRVHGLDLTYFTLWQVMLITLYFFCASIASAIGVYYHDLVYNNTYAASGDTYDAHGVNASQSIDEHGAPHHHQQQLGYVRPPGTTVGLPTDQYVGPHGDIENHQNPNNQGRIAGEYIVPTDRQPEEAHTGRDISTTIHPPITQDRVYREVNWSYSMRAFGSFIQILYEVAASCALLTVIVVYASGIGTLEWVDVSQHILVFAIFAVELCLNMIEVRFEHILLNEAWILLYLTVIWGLVGSETLPHWPYQFIETNSRMSLGIYAVGFFGSCLIYTVWLAMNLAKFQIVHHHIAPMYDEQAQYETRQEGAYKPPKLNNTQDNLSYGHYNAAVSPANVQWTDNENRPGFQQRQDVQRPVHI